MKVIKWVAGGVLAVVLLVSVALYVLSKSQNNHLGKETNRVIAVIREDRTCQFARDANQVLSRDLKAITEIVSSMDSRLQSVQPGLEVVQGLERRVLCVEGKAQDFPSMEFMAGLHQETQGVIRDEGGRVEGSIKETLNEIVAGFGRKLERFQLSKSSQVLSERPPIFRSMPPYTILLKVRGETRSFFVVELHDPNSAERALDELRGDGWEIVQVDILDNEKPRLHVVTKNLVFLAPEEDKRQKKDCSFWKSWKR